MMGKSSEGGEESLGEDMGEEEVYSKEEEEILGEEMGEEEVDSEEEKENAEGGQFSLA